MESPSRWVKREIQCPQDMRPSYLLVEYRMGKDGKETLGSVHCDNPYLRDLGGGDCDWSCWEKISTSPHHGIPKVKPQDGRSDR